MSLKVLVVCPGPDRDRHLAQRLQRGSTSQQHWPHTASQVCRATASTGRRRRSSRDPCPDPLTFNPRTPTESLVRLKGAGQPHATSQWLPSSPTESTHGFCSIGLPPTIGESVQGRLT